MKLGWDPIDELEDDAPTSVWASVIFVVLLVIVVIAKFI